MNTELISLLASKPNLSSQTVKTYKSMYNRLILLIGQPVGNVAEQTIIERVSTVINPNTQAGLINIAMAIKTNQTRPTQLLKSAADNLRGAIKSHSNTVNIDKGAALPTMGEIHAYTESLRVSKQPTKYIINYLLSTFGVRNVDVDVYITNDKDLANTGPDNYLLVMFNQIKFIRNKYKTHSTYGKKEIIIRDPRFIKIIRALDNGWLLTNPDKTHISAGSVGNMVLRSTLDHIGEGSIFKILVEDAKNHPDVFARITQLSEWRGTDVGTILARYDIKRTKA